MTFIIPNQQTKQHAQTNKNDLSGTIYQSRNISLDKEGYIKLAEATYAQMTTDDDADLSGADAMYPSDGLIFVNSDEVFSGDLGTAVLTNRSSDTTSPSPGTEEDVIYFNGTEVVSDGTSVYYRSASTAWTAVTSAVTSGGRPTCMTVWDAENNLCVGSKNVVKFINTSWAVSGTVLTLPLEYEVFSMVSNGSQLFIATRNKSGGDAKVFVINTIGTSADAVFSAEAFEVMSIKRFKSSVAIINSYGKLMRFNGGGFSELAILPVYVENIEWSDAQNDYSTVSNRGMFVDGDLIYINLSSLTQNGKYRMLPNFPSGIWCYDDSIKSLYHKYSPSYTRIQKVDGSDVTVSTTNNDFTLTSGDLNSVVTGMPLLYSDGSSPLIPELKESIVYYVIKMSSTVFKLATSYTNALAGTAIDITGVGGINNDYFIYKTNDYGWTIYGNRSSIAVLNNLLYDDTVASRIAFTAELGAKQAVATDVTVFGGTTPYLPNRGYFITPKIESVNVEDSWQKLYLKFRPLRVDEKIILKYKSETTNEFPFSSIQYAETVNWVADWTDTDTFTTIADLSSVVAGDEIEIIAGVGSGHIAHVSSISVNAGTYTVNLDEAFPFAVSGDEFYFIVDKWIYMDTIDVNSSTNAKGYFESPIAKNSTSLQFKIELRGIDVTINELQIINKTDRPSA